MCVAGVFICRGKEDALVTKNMVVGESVYGEKRISVEASDELCFTVARRSGLQMLTVSISRRNLIKSGYLCENKSVQKKADSLLLC